MLERPFLVPSKRKTVRRDGLLEAGTHSQQGRRDRDKDRNEK